jgi:hypothetical protein
MKSLIRLFIFAFSLALTGCAGLKPPSKDEIANAYYGSFPTNYRSDIESLIRPRLKDPDSARFTYFMEPTKGYYKWGRLEFGYEVCVYLNAKNSYGAYTGNKIEYFMFRDGRIVVAHGTYDSQYQEYVMNFCGKYTR